MARLPKVVKYVDIPLQHSHSDVLKAMARPLHPEKVVERIRKLVPDVKIRSTFIVGFPGETEEQVQHLADFIAKYEFDRLGVFCYSKQKEVESGSMPNQIAERTKKARRKKIMSIQHEIAFKQNRKMVGRIIDVLIESYDDKKNLFVGRSQWDAPSIDNLVYVSDAEGTRCILGDFTRVRVTEAKPYDLYGEALEDLEPISNIADLALSARA
jgi:ribosomal protein S12 methylthiotransferase